MLRSTLMSNEFIELFGLESVWDDPIIRDPYPHKTQQMKEALKKAREEHKKEQVVFDKESYEIQKKLRGKQNYEY